MICKVALLDLCVQEDFVYLEQSHDGCSHVINTC